MKAGVAAICVGVVLLVGRPAAAEGAPEAPKPGASEGFNPFEQFRWYVGVGATHPVGALSTLSDSNIALRLSATFDLSPGLALLLSGGFNQFTAEPTTTISHPRWINGTFGAKLTREITPTVRVYLHGGPGLYLAKEGGFTVGGFLGGGLQLPIVGQFRLEMGLDVHVLASNWQFLTALFGVSFQ